MRFIGIDVGAHGGIAVIDDQGVVLSAVPMPETDAELLAAVMTTKTAETIYAMLERSQASPQMGVRSAFSYGGAYRACRMALTAAQIPFDEVAPARWQRALFCLSGGDKNVTKARAQQLFPSVKMTHQIADALLIAEYCRRTHRRIEGDSEELPTW